MVRNNSKSSRGGIGTPGGAETTISIGGGALGGVPSGSVVGVAPGDVVVGDVAPGAIVVVVVVPGAVVVVADDPPATVVDVVEEVVVAPSPPAMVVVVTATSGNSLSPTHNTM